MENSTLLSTLLSIGQFANATQLSAKALRLYAENAILPPAFVDEANGYRYYRPEQVRIARVLRTLRDMDMPLAQIARCIQSAESLADLSKSHMDAQLRAFLVQQAAYQTLLTGLSAPTFPAQAAVQRIALPATQMLVIPFTASTRTLQMWAHQTIKSIEGGGHSLSTQPGILPLHAPLDSVDECALELWMPAMTERVNTQHDVRQQAAIELACIALQRTAEAEPDLLAASDALFDWFDRQGKILHGQPMILIKHDCLELAWPLP